MPNRSWFYASDGQQQGPYPDAQLRELIARGTVTADTLVWSEGMAGWQRAGEIPGLFSGGLRAHPPFRAPAFRWPVRGGYGGGALSIDFGILGFHLAQSLVFVIGFLFVIPAPWVVLIYFYQWIVSRVRVPQRPNLAFTGKSTISGMSSSRWRSSSIVASRPAVPIAQLSVTVTEFSAYLSWLIDTWIVSNLSSNGQPLPARVSPARAGPIIGWHLLRPSRPSPSSAGRGSPPPGCAGYAAMSAARIARSFSTRRAWRCLWRTLVVAIGCVFLIPIPWVLRWYTSWYVSQFELVERAA